MTRRIIINIFVSVKTKSLVVTNIFITINIFVMLKEQTKKLFISAIRKLYSDASVKLLVMTRRIIINIFVSVKTKSLVE